MPLAIPPAMIKELRHHLASAISDTKAYDVPGLCRRLNLADGDEQEAFSSKYKYAQKRLVEVSAEQVVASARQLAAEEQHFELGEQLAKIDELNGPTVTTLTRRRLIALFEGRPLAREIEDIELIRSLWPIGSMRAPHPSDEATLEDYLHRHTIRNDDLTQRDVLETLGLLSCSRAQLFKFLAAVTAPDAFSGNEQVELAEKIDSLLRHDGYTLALAGRISGSPFYAVRPAPAGSPADASISATLAAFDPTQVHARWTMAMERRASEPAGAITLARTLLEDVCKWILDQAGEIWQETDDLPVLYRKLAKVLKLAPDDHTEQVFKQILGSCQSVVESLGALRNKLSDAHSSGPKRARPQPRHAELAVNLAGAMATFLVATSEARKSEAGGPTTPASSDASHQTGESGKGRSPRNAVAGRIEPGQSRRSNRGSRFAGASGGRIVAGYLPIWACQAGRRSSEKCRRAMLSLGAPGQRAKARRSGLAPCRDVLCRRTTQRKPGPGEASSPTVAVTLFG